MIEKKDRYALCIAAEHKLTKPFLSYYKLIFFISKKKTAMPYA